MSIRDHLTADRLDVSALGVYLDALDHAIRVREVRTLSAREQALLFDAAAGVRPIALGDLVPPEVPPLTQVIHHGRNSLPVLHAFEKRFCRPAQSLDELWGYNEHGLRWLTGPGYFVARRHGEAEVLIDYLTLPPAKPDAWPTIKPNSAGASRFVYLQTQDVLRGVSRHVSIGRDTKKGKPLDRWFVLCRSEEPA
jgi:hypothetical protein